MLPDMPRKKSARRARSLPYLKPVRDAAGDVVGYRFIPGPGLREKGWKAISFVGEGGRWLRYSDVARAYEEGPGGLPAAAAPTIAPPATPKGEKGGKAKAVKKPADPDKQTLEALWRAFETSDDFDFKPDGTPKSEETKRFYRTNIKPWLEWAGDVAVWAIGKKAILEHYKQVLRVKLSAHAAHAALRALQAVLAYAEREGWIAINPALRLRLARPPKGKRAWTLEEIRFAVAMGDQLGGDFVYAADALVTAVETGLRQADDLDVQYAQVSASEIYCTETSGPGGSDKRPQKTRNNTGAEVVAAITTRLHARILIMRTRFVEIFGRPPADDDYLIPFVGDRQRWRLEHKQIRPTPRAWSKDTFRHVFADLVAACAEARPGMAGLEFRQLRRTYMTELAEYGADVWTLAVAGGKSFASMAEEAKTYVRRSPRMAAKARTLLEEGRGE